MWVFFFILVGYIYLNLQVSSMECYEIDQEKTAEYIFDVDIGEYFTDVLLRSVDKTGIIKVVSHRASICYRLVQI